MTFHQSPAVTPKMQGPVFLMSSPPGPFDLEYWTFLFFALPTKTTNVFTEWCLSFDATFPVIRWTWEFLQGYFPKSHVTLPSFSRGRSLVSPSSGLGPTLFEDRSAVVFFFPYRLYCRDLSLRVQRKALRRCFVNHNITLCTYQFHAHDGSKSVEKVLFSSSWNFLCKMLLSLVTKNW